MSGIEGDLPAEPDEYESTQDPTARCDAVDRLGSYTDTHQPRDREPESGERQSRAGEVIPANPGTEPVGIEPGENE